MNAHTDQTPPARGVTALTLAARGVTALVAGGLVVLLTHTGAAMASPAAGEGDGAPDAAAVATLRDEVERLEVDAELAVERYNEARSSLAEHAARELAAQGALDVTADRLRASRSASSSRVRALYRTGGIELVRLSAWQGDDLAAVGAALHTAEIVLAGDAAAVAEARRHHTTAAHDAERLLQLRADRVSAEVLADHRRVDADAAVRSAQDRLDRADAELVRALEAERRAEADAAAAAAWRGRGPRGDLDRSDVVASAIDRAPSAAATAAIRYATEQLGTPYRWGATGPGAFDCSGLTSVAYASAGVGLPRTSRQQYTGLPRVPVTELAPGDLVFYARGSEPDTIHHVGLYLGDGLMVHAPRAGDVVRLAAVDWSRTYGAVRPAA